MQQNNFLINCHYLLFKNQIKLLIHISSVNGNFASVNAAESAAMSTKHCHFIFLFFLITAIITQNFPPPPGHFSIKIYISSLHQISISWKLFFNGLLEELVA